MTEIVRESGITDAGKLAIVCTVIALSFLVSIFVSWYIKNSTRFKNCCNRFKSRLLSTLKGKSTSDTQIESPPYVTTVSETVQHLAVKEACNSETNSKSSPPEIKITFEEPSVTKSATTNGRSPRLSARRRSTLDTLDEIEEDLIMSLQKNELLQTGSLKLVFDDPDDECENVLPAPVSEKVVSLDEVVKCAVDEIQIQYQLTS
ncbi:uncharacterized protein LOC142336721 [Convolutriloba macropyga]|uniref:uncharacterized protein LOC142336721 n=1 Tax=Convolutriloba macropyga TaxID=536237 RepID=UPI003F52174A